MAKEVVIEHRDGRRYGVTLTDFHRLYEDEGFKVVAEADNTTPYVAPEPKAAAKPKNRSSRAKPKTVPAAPVAETSPAETPGAEG